MGRHLLRDPAAVYMPVMVGELLLEPPHPFRSDPQEVVSKDLYHGQKDAVITQQLRPGRVRLGEGALPHRVCGARRVAEPTLADRFEGIDEIGYFRGIKGLPANDKPEGVKLLELVVAECGVLRHQISIRAQ
jgi:hypothetical protein